MFREPIFFSNGSGGSQGKQVKVKGISAQTAFQHYKKTLSEVL